MSIVKDKIALIYDNGLFCEQAVRLAQEFKTVWYYTPWKNAFPKSKMDMIGMGLEGVTRISNFFDYVEKADIIIFPDVYDGDLQLYLRSKGKRVWGSFKGDELELNRWESKQHMKKVGLAVQPIVKIKGLDNLKEHLKKVKNKYVKISIYRGDFETFYHKKYSLSEPIMKSLSDKMGPIANIIDFIVEDPISGEDVVECGFDGYCIDGQFPKKCLSGYEIKDLGYIGVVKNYDDLSPIVKEPNEKLSETLKKYKYRNFLSTEIRVGKDKIPYNIDPCQRCGSPPNELYQEMFENLGEIIWYGAEGKMIEPKFRAKYGIEVLMHSDWVNDNWQAIDFPKEIRRWVKLRNACKINGRYYVIPMDSGLPEMGAVVAIGDSVKEVIEKVKGYVEKVEGYRLDIKVGSIENMKDVVSKGEKLGLKFD